MRMARAALCSGERRGALKGPLPPRVNLAGALGFWGQPGSPDDHPQPPREHQQGWELCPELAGSTGTFPACQIPVWVTLQCRVASPIPCPLPHRLSLLPLPVSAQYCCLNPPLPQPQAPTALLTTLTPPCRLRVLAGWHSQLLPPVPSTVLVPGRKAGAAAVCRLSDELSTLRDKGGCGPERVTHLGWLVPEGSPGKARGSA